MSQANSQHGGLEQRPSDQELQLLLGSLHSLPTLSCVAAGLLELASPTAAIDRQKCHALLRLDVAMSAQLLALAQQYNAGCVTAEQALALLDDQTLRNLLLGAMTTQQEGPFNLPEFWRHSLAVAQASQEIAQHLSPRIDPQAAFTCGLLHDIGKLAAWQLMPKSYARALASAGSGGPGLLQAEMNTLNADHPTIGMRLCQQWQLPPLVQEVVWLHHQAATSLPQSLVQAEMVAIVALADTVARELRVGFSGNTVIAHSSIELAGRLGLDEATLQQIAIAVGPAVEAHGKTLRLGSDGAQSYRSALAQSSRQLAQLNQNLHQRSIQLERQARALELVQNFTRSLSSTAGVSDVLVQAGRAIASAAGVEFDANQPVLTYSLTDESQEILVACIGGKDVNWLTLTRTQAAKTTASLDPQPAPLAAKELLARPDDLQEYIVVGQYLHRPMVSAGRWIGGSFLPAAAGPDHLPEETQQALAATVALALAIVQGRQRAQVLSEQLAQASQVLEQAHEAVSEARTLSAVGEMAAGAAHELNNPLAIISGRAQLMLMKAQTDEQRKTWRTLAEQAQRISDIISELMAFAAPPPPNYQPTSVQNIFEQARQMFLDQDDPQVKASTVDIRIDAEVIPVQADGQQIAEVLAELMKNAAYAAGKGAAITLQGEALSDRPQVLLRVCDNGPGMNAATMAKAFTPFFSAQAAGRRRGLGLPRARRTVEANGGRLWLESQPGNGTSAFVLLRACEQE